MIDSMPARLQAVIGAGGNPIPYYIGVDTTFLSPQIFIVTHSFRCIWLSLFPMKLREGVGYSAWQVVCRQDTKRTLVV